MKARLAQGNQHASASPALRTTSGPGREGPARGSAGRGSSSRGALTQLSRVVGNRATLELFREAAGRRAADRSARRRLESEADRLGEADPGSVMLRDDGEAGRLASAFRADALTIGETVYFAPGRYSPHSNRGRRLLAHELGHVEQQRSGRAPYSVQLRSRAAEVEDHLGFFDSAEDAVTALNLLASMSAADFNDTIEAMARSGSIVGLIHRLPGRGQVVRFLNVLADRGTRTNQEAVFAANPLLNLSAENSLIVFGRRHAANLGARGPAPAPGLAGSLISRDSSAPFTGGGARGRLASDAPISLSEMWTLRSQGQEAARRFGSGGVKRAKYNRIPGLEMLYDWSNPIKGSLTGPGSYLAGLTTAERQGQARLLFGQEIATSFGRAYAGSLPSRIQVVRAAADAHDLEPELVAGIILAEQRDQSLREDAVDFRGASLGGRSTSIGLGQVTVATAKRENLFADLVSPGLEQMLTTNNKLGRSMIPALLASDEFNIFAVARYLRIVADLGATKAPAALPNTMAWTGALNLPAYANHSRTWTDAHVRLIGSEYTSAPFDDVLVPGWGEFVLQAYKDVKAAGIF